MPVINALSVELVKFRMLIFALTVGTVAEIVSTVKSTVTLHLVGTNGATKVLDDATQ